MNGQFSRRCVIAAVDVLEGAWYHSNFTAFLMELGPSIYLRIRKEPISLKNRLSDLKGVYDQDPSVLIEGEPLARILVERAVSHLPGEPANSWSQPAHLTPAMETFKRTLEMDGYTVTDGALRRILPADIGLPETESELLRLLDVYQLYTAKGHLRQAMDTHARGDWAAANGQLRTFFDALLDSLAERVDPSARGCRLVSPAGPNSRRRGSSSRRCMNGPTTARATSTGSLGDCILRDRTPAFRTRTTARSGSIRFY